MTTPEDLAASNLFQVKGYVAVVSGGSSGIGLMAAQTLAANGARVYVIGKREEMLDTVAEKYSSNGKIIPLPGDTTTTDGINGIATVLTTQEDKGINILLNAASVSSEKQASSLPTTSTTPAAGGSIDFTNSDVVKDWMTADGPDAWGISWAGNVTSHHFLTAALLPLLDKGAKAAPGHSSIVVNIANLAGVTKTHSQGRFAYSASMAALMHLTKEWANAFLEMGIRVNCIAPSIVEGEMRATGLDAGRRERMDERVREKVPAGRAGKEGDIASVVLWLCSRAGTYVNGQVIHVDGGLLLESPGTT